MNKDKASFIIQLAVLLADKHEVPLKHIRGISLMLDGTLYYTILISGVYKDFVVNVSEFGLNFK